MNQDNHRQRQNFSITAVAVIILGIIFLLNNFGILPWEIWENLWKFWPVLLILFGIEILIGKNSSPRGLGFIFILIFIIPVILVLNPLTGNPLARGKVETSKPLGNLSRASVFFDFASSNITVSALPKDSTLSLKGSLSYSQILPKPEEKEEKRFGEVKYAFSQSGKNFPFLNSLGNKVEFQLSPLIPFELSLKSATGVTNLDLKELRVDFLEIDTAAGTTNVVFSPNYPAKVFIKAGAGLVSLTIPSELGTEIRTNTKFKSIKLDTNRFNKNGDNYKSTNFDTATNKLSVEISGQAASIEIK